MCPILSIVIPAYNRVPLLRSTLESIKQSITGLSIEIIVVDDGSEPAIADQILGFLELPIQVIRQSNQGCVVAKNRGWQAAQGTYVSFIDSDDLVHPEKFRAQLERLEATGADVCYTDETSARLEQDSLITENREPFEIAQSPTDLYLKLQPAASNLIYRRSYLMQYLSQPLIPESRIFGPIGEVWLYYNLVIHPAQIVKAEGHYSIFVEHDQARLTNHWEKLGVASLILMSEFMRNCPDRNSTIEPRRQVGESAFMAWRRLPRNFNPQFERTMLHLWQTAPKGDLQNLGGRGFQQLSQFIGIQNAAMLLRYLQRPRYAKIRTLSHSELQTIMAQLNSPQLSPA